MSREQPSLDAVMRPINLTKNLPFIDGGSAVLNVTADPSLLLQPFAHAQTNIGAISVTAEAGNDIVFRGNGDKVTFNLSATGKAGAGVFLDGDGLAKALSLDGDVTLNMPPNDQTHYTVLNCGFDVKASANGSVALGVGGSVTFGVDASADATFAVVQAFKDDPVRTGLAELTAVANEWKLPANIASVGDETGLDPGSWVITEVDGTLDLKLAAQYGLDFNWVRTLKAGGFGGDIGLKLQLGLNAALGFNASGTFVVVVGRESSARIVRIQLFRRSHRGSSFTFSAAADFEPKVPVPGSSDDLIKAIFGTHSAQIIDDLHFFKQWDGKISSLTGLFADAGLDRALKLLKDATGVDPAVAFDEAKAKLSAFLDKWNNLDHAIASRILKFVADNKELTEVKAVAALIANGQKDDFAAFLGDKLQDIGFFQTPVGQFLESVSSDGLVALLDSDQFQAAKAAAQTTLDVLDGSEIEKVLNNIQQKVIAALDLQPLLDLAGKIDQMTFDQLDKLLKAKLAVALDKAISAMVPADVEKIIKTAQNLIAQFDNFLQKTKDALNRKYSLDFMAQYQSETNRTALLDLSLNFELGDQHTLSRILSDAIKGSVNIDSMLTQHITGVTLNKGRLTHEIKRQSHAELNMPYFSATSDTLITAVAGMTTAETQDGRIFGYDLRAQSLTQAQVAARYHRTSTLAVAASIPVPAGSSLRNFGAQSMTYSFKLDEAVMHMRVKAFEAQAGNYLNAFFLPTLQAGNKKPQDWLSEIEKKADPGGSETLGNTLLRLEMEVPAKFAGVWLQPPTTTESAMPGALRRALQVLIPFYYLSDLSNFSNLTPVDSLLIFQAADLSRVDFSNPNSTTISNIIALVTNGDVQDNNSPLGKVLSFWFDRLKAANGPNSSFYENVGVNRLRIVNSVVSPGGSPTLLMDLLIGTTQALGAATNARTAIRNFLATATLEPSRAIQSLARFGDQLVTAFGNISKVYGGQALSPLGTLAFTETARVLSGNAGTVTAMLDVAVLTLDAKPDQLPDSGPSPSQVLAGNRLLAVSVPAHLPMLPAALPPNP